MNAPLGIAIIAAASALLGVACSVMVIVSPFASLPMLVASATIALSHLPHIRAAWRAAQKGDVDATSFGVPERVTTYRIGGISPGRIHPPPQTPAPPKK